MSPVLGRSAKRTEPAPLALLPWLWSSAPLISTVVSLCIHVVVLLVLSVSNTNTEEEQRIAVVITTASADEDVLHEALPDELEVMLPEPHEIEPDDIPVITDTTDIALVSYEVLDSSVESFEREALGTADLSDLLAGVANGSTGDVDGLAIEISERVDQAGGQQGYMQISLAWDNRNDLDLEVITPSREKIWSKRKHSRCGGMLDVDANWTDFGGSTKHVTDRPVENIVWKDPPKKKGSFKVYIDCYSIRDGHRQTPYVVLVKFGDTTRQFTGQFTGIHKRTLVAEFNPTNFVDE